MFKLHTSLLFLCILGMQLNATAQTIDLFADSVSKPSNDIITSSFKTTRIVNGHSIENVGAGILDFKIMHRFGAINQGGYEFFGLDQATMRIGLDYGITKNLMIGIGRSTFQKQFDGFVKYKALSQQTGERNIPLSISYVGSAIYKSLKDASTTYQPYVSDKFSFAHQILFARKFNDQFSLQLTPTLLHYNIVENVNIPNDFYSLGIGFRQRITKRVNITTEYFYRIDKLDGYYDPLSVGVDIETGGHVFQVHFTNAQAMFEEGFITQAQGDWLNGDFFFGCEIFVK